MTPDSQHRILDSLYLCFPLIQPRTIKRIWRSSNSKRRSANCRRTSYERTTLSYDRTTKRDDGTTSNSEHKDAKVDIYIYIYIVRVACNLCLNTYEDVIT
ncbi:unnamed protein product [Camellia sinensis]